MEVSIHDYVDWREEQRSFEDLVAFYSGTVNISGQEKAERFDGSFITPSAFDMLEVQPIRGRLFREEEAIPDAPGVVLLGYEVCVIDTISGMTWWVGRSASMASR